MENICSKIAGGMLEQNDSEYIVSVKFDNNEELVKVKPVNHEQNPQELMQELSNLTGSPIKDIIVSVYCVCVGLDGSKMN